MSDNWGKIRDRQYNPDLEIRWRRPVQSMPLWIGTSLNGLCILLVLVGSVTTYNKINGLEQVFRSYTTKCRGRVILLIIN